MLPVLSTNTRVFKLTQMAIDLAYAIYVYSNSLIKIADGV